MLQLQHGEAASVLNALTERSPEFATAIDLIDPIGNEGGSVPVAFTDEDIARLTEIIGVEPTDPGRNFQSGVRFEVPQGFEVDEHREILTAIIQRVLDGGGEVLTRANTSW